MKKFSKVGKRVMALFIIALLNINTYATQSSNDGSAFVTKAEFDTLMQNFNENMNIYQADLNAKIDDAIASYIGGLSGTTSVNISLPGYLWMKSYGNDVNLVELGIDTRKTEEVKDEKDMFRFGKLYTYAPKYYFGGTLTACVAYSASAVYQAELYVNHIISGYSTTLETGTYESSSNGRNYSTPVTEDKLISINPSIYLTESGKNYVNKVVKAPKVIDSENGMVTSSVLSGSWTYGGFFYYLSTSPSSSYDLFALNDSGVYIGKNVNVNGYNLYVMDIGTNVTSSIPSGFTNVGNMIFGASTNVVGVKRNSYYTHSAPRMTMYSRIVNYTNEINHIVPRFLKLPDDVSSQDATKIMAVEDKKGNDYNSIKNQLTKTSVRSVGSQKVWYPVGNMKSGFSYVPLQAGIAYSVKSYELKNTRFKAQELYDYYVKDTYNTDVSLADRVIVYRNEELDSVKLQFQIVPTSNFLLTFSSNKEYQDGETNLYKFDYSGGVTPVQGSEKSFAIDSSNFDNNHPLNIEISDIPVNGFVWLGGQSINDGYVTFRFVEKALVLK